MVRILLIGNNGFATTVHLLQRWNEFQISSQLSSNWKNLIPDDEYLKNELNEEATYYNLQSFLNVLEEVEPKCSDSTLLSEEHQKVVNTWCGNPNQKWKLIYRVIHLACTLTNSIRQLEMDFHQLTFTINVIIKVQQ